MDDTLLHLVIPISLGLAPFALGALSLWVLTKRVTCPPDHVLVVFGAAGAMPAGDRFDPMRVVKKGSLRVVPLLTGYELVPIPDRTLRIACPCPVDGGATAGQISVELELAVAPTRNTARAAVSWMPAVDAETQREIIEAVATDTLLGFSGHLSAVLQGAHCSEKIRSFARSLDRSLSDFGWVTKTAVGGGLWSGARYGSDA